MRNNLANMKVSSQGEEPMYRKLLKEDFYNFFEILKEQGKVYGPTSIGGSSHEFREVSSPDQVNLNYTRTMIPPKKFFVKPEEKIYDFDEEKGLYKPSMDPPGTTVILGIHPCDINALRLLDRVYMDDAPDVFYMMRRKNTVLIGVSCHPDEYCFCKSMGTSYATEGFDLFLHELSDGYFIRVGSEKGYKIIGAKSDIFKDPEPRDFKEFKLNEKEREKEFKLELNVLGLQDLLDLAFDSSVWKETADECFGCGICNLTCPTCRCYDIADYVGLNIKTSERRRRWDSCMLRKHGLVAGGLNFRPTRVERLRNRFNCKGSLREGMLNCVGCGRCTVYCPADINYVEILKKVRGEL
jgi:sulfhydrogenase subunit beta (sulfur reductase)